MSAIARGWRRFRDLPEIAQAGAWVALIAVYSVALVLVLGDDGDDGARPRPLSPLERRVSQLVGGVEPKRPTDPNDVNRFRRPHVLTVACKGDVCDIVYSVGLPGRGRILEDQREMWERLFARTPIVKATMTVTRDVAAAGVPVKSSEETPTGAPLIRTTCDRSHRRNVDWASARGAEILAGICVVDGYDQGRIHRQPAVAGDDPAAKDLDLPEARK